MIRINNTIISICFICIIFAGCNRSLDSLESWQSPDCKNLKDGIILLNSEITKTEINKMLSDLEPHSIDKDRGRQFENITTLIERINSNCDSVTAALICYGCIKTLPPQTEILLTADSSGTTIQRVIDIVTPDDDILQCTEIHKYYN